MEQGSQEWIEARLGKVTASRVADVVARTKKGTSASRSTYEMQLICERLTGSVQQRYKSPAMLWGTETEAQARAAYEFMHDVEVGKIGFVVHPKIFMSGASPDGLVGDDGLIEVKCPNTTTHVSTLISDEISGEYIIQMQWQMACTGRNWCDFVSFDPAMPGDLQLFVKRVEADDERIAFLQGEVRGFLAEIDAKIARLTALRRAA